MENWVRWSNLSVIWTPKGRDRENGAEEISDEITTEIFRNNESDQSLFVKITSKITKKKFTLGCIIVKLQKTKKTKKQY